MPTAAPPKYLQGTTDVEYRKKYGSGQAATEARIRAILQHRGRTPSAGRVTDIYTRRGKEYNTAGYNQLREFAQPGSSQKTSTGGGKSKDSKDTSVRSERRNALADALAAIGAQWQFERGNLQSQLTGLGNQWKMRNQEIMQQRGDTREAMLEDMIKRGVGRSSLTAQGYADIEKDVQRAKGQNLQMYGTKATAGAHGTQAQQLQSAIELLVKQRALAEKQAKAQSSGGQLNYESLLELIGTGIAGSGMASY